MKKRAWGLAGAAFLVAGQAVAADLANRPTYRTPPFNWTGCYIGADVGGAWARQNSVVTPSAATLQGAVASDLRNDSSVIGGAHAGCNYQIIPAWAIGLEGDYSWLQFDSPASGPNLGLNGSPAGPGGVLVSRSNDWLASMRARLGWVVVPNALIYGTGGAAWTRSNYEGLDTFTNGSLSTSFGETKTGWVVGGGVDWAPWNNGWTVRAEYLHYQFGGASPAAVDPLNAPNSVTFGFGDLKIDTVRAGLSYKF